MENLSFEVLYNSHFSLIFYFYQHSPAIMKRNLLSGKGGLILLLLVTVLATLLSAFISIPSRVAEPLQCCPGVPPGGRA